VAHPDKVVISVSGDGGFMFGVQELATAVQHGINVIAIVFNNGAYGNVLRDQRDSYQGHYLGSELTNPDFVRLAESFGALAYRATTPDELRVRLAESMNAERPVVIEVPVERGSEASPWPFIHPQAPQ
jgi:acetolactate synthase-1/2/3 large subunit